MSILCRERLPTFLRLQSHLVKRRAWSSVRRISTSPSSEPPDEVPDFGEYEVILPDEPFVWGVSHITPRVVPPHIRRPSYAITGKEEPSMSPRIRLGSEEEERCRNAARLAKKVREFASTLVKPGVTTNAIDSAIHEYILSHTAYPSPLLYEGFPRSCCTSVNNIVAHGIPDDRPLLDGDIVNIDVTVFLDGFHGDTSRTFLVGDVDEQGRNLVKASVDALNIGISACGPGQPYRNIGRAIHELIGRRSQSFPLIESNLFAGHGIGTVFHKPPWIYHTVNEEPEKMQPGDCFTIEPSIIQGTNPQCFIFPDGWTASTENTARSSQAEHQILITESGVDVLTL